MVEQLESFIDAFITNMPDVLRKLRVDEDEQRQLSQTHEHDLDLERFLVIIAFTFEGRPEAAQSFWSDPDSNLAGFLSWASRRASTPLVSAFCEMLQALSEDEESATAAHHFLLDEGPASSGKMKRSYSLTWSQIFKELTFFSSRIRDRPTSTQSPFQRGGGQNNGQSELEPEENMMLQSYLRLITRLCTESEIARDFILKHPTFHITDLLYQLASIPTSNPLFPRERSSRLRGCAFNTLRSLLSHKSRDIGEFLWSSLDVWMSGGYMPAVKTPALASASNPPISDILQEIRTGFEEPSAFIQLLQALVTPYEDEGGLNDLLPFPELLGSSNRMPGIDPYIDFVGEVFGKKIIEISDPLHARLLSLTCLEFFATCLSTFNEDLVIFASQSNIAVDGAIRASDLATYLRLHPFSKVMPWIFNDGVMARLFATIHQDVAEVGNASPDSPLVLSILRAIDVITLVLDLQPTYLDIVRPLIKLQPTQRREPVANAAYASFEDGILNNLYIITDLGLYCGVGHAPLTISALKLLERLSTAPKLIGSQNTGLQEFSDRNRAIAAIESNNDAERIGRSLINELLSSLELDEGPESDTYVIKTHILDFLNACLESSPVRPSIAHLILGFQCGTDTVDIRSGSPFSAGSSMFHTVLSLAIEYPVGDESSGILSWAISLKYKAFKVLKTLWTSPLTSRLVMRELRDNEFMSNILTRDIIVTPQTLWDGRLTADEEFMTSNSSKGLLELVRFRAAFLQYAASELRQIAREHVPSLRERTLMSLQGYTSNDGRQIQNPTVFDLFDFMELEVPAQDLSLSPEYFKDLDLSICAETKENSFLTYNLRRVQEIMILRRNEFRKLGLLQTPQEEISFETEAQTLLVSLEVENQRHRIQASLLSGLDGWVQAMVMMIETGGLDGTKKTSFVLQALQVILPKLERYSFERLDESLSLSKLAKLLIFSLDFNLESFQKGDIGDLASDRLFQLFQVCLRVIHSPIANSDLKETLYAICYRYLSGMSDVAKDSAHLKKHSTYTIKSMGERLMDVICDDAFAGDQTCRISALLLLGAFVTLAREEGSQYIIDALVRLNFTSLIVDSLKDILGEIHGIDQEGMYSIQEILLILLTEFDLRFTDYLLLRQTCSIAQYCSDEIWCNSRL
jgi:nuclear pore complex protein Nup205